MVLGSGRAPGKVILFGEHAVVYGRPALAVPVTEVYAEVEVTSGAPGAGLILQASDLGRTITLRTAGPDDPLAAAARLTLAALNLAEPDWQVEIHATIPMASGMGSGAAVSVALARALAAAAGTTLADESVSALAYEVEKLHHGTPSGVDNTVIAYGRPVRFVRGAPPCRFTIHTPFMLAIADSGVASPTRAAVGDVRAAWQREPALFEPLFDRVGDVVEAAATALATGTNADLGPLMDENHALLQEIGVSCPELDLLVAAARSAGALGAKLSGAGRGGNMIALVRPDESRRVASVLRASGARNVIVTTVG